MSFVKDVSFSTCWFYIGRKVYNYTNMQKSILNGFFFNQIQSSMSNFLKIFFTFEQVKHATNVEKTKFYFLAINRIYLNCCGTLLYHEIPHQYSSIMLLTILVYVCTTAWPQTMISTTRMNWIDGGHLNLNIG